MWLPSLLPTASTRRWRHRPSIAYCSDRDWTSTASFAANTRQELPVAQSLVRRSSAARPSFDRLSLVHPVYTTRLTVYEDSTMRHRERRAGTACLARRTVMGVDHGSGYSLPTCARETKRRQPTRVGSGPPREGSPARPVLTRRSTQAASEMPSLCRPRPL